MSDRLEELKEFMEREEYFYKIGDTITLEEYKYLSSGKVPMFRIKQRLLPPFRDGMGTGVTCSVEFECVGCGEKKLLEPKSKAELFRIVTTQGHKCFKCNAAELARINEEIARKANESRLREEEWKRKEWANLLSPGLVFKKGMSPYQKIEWVERVIRGREAEAEELILEMDYQDFLQTPYWKAVASMVRKKNKYKCVLCGESYGLNVHHKTYENHGAEHLHLDDLTLLCSECHEKFHEEEE